MKNNRLQHLNNYERRQLQVNGWDLENESHRNILKALSHSFSADFQAIIQKLIDSGSI
jgi:hypothetical protein